MDLEMSFTLLVMSMYSVLPSWYTLSFLSGTLLSTHYCLVESIYLICYVSFFLRIRATPVPVYGLLPIYSVQPTITNTLLQPWNIFQTPGMRNQGNEMPTHIFSAPELYIVSQNMGLVWIFCSSDSVGLWVCSKRQGLTCKRKQRQKGKKSPRTRTREKKKNTMSTEWGNGNNHTYQGHANADGLSQEVIDEWSRGQLCGRLKFFQLHRDLI